MVGNSNADADGYCSSPFVPTVLMKKRFAVNVSAQYVAFASIYDATITVNYPDGSSNKNSHTVGSDLHFYRILHILKIFLQVLCLPETKRMQGWYEPNTNDFGSKDDETIMIGYD